MKLRTHSMIELALAGDDSLPPDDRQAILEAWRKEAADDGLSRLRSIPFPNLADGLLYN